MRAGRRPAYDGGVSTHEQGNTPAEALDEQRQIDAEVRTSEAKLADGEVPAREQPGGEGETHTPAGDGGETGPQPWTAGTFKKLARTSEAVAQTAELSAAVHDGAVGTLPGAAEHAETDRRFAAAERAAAAAFRRGEVPPDEVRQVIRDPGPPVGDQQP